MTPTPKLSKIIVRMQHTRSYRWVYDCTFDIFRLCEDESSAVFITARNVWEMNAISRELKTAGFDVLDQMKAANTHANALNPIDPMMKGAYEKR